MKLSGRERAVLPLLVAGMPNKIIAHRLAIAAGTLQAHIANMARKLGVSTRGEIVRWALTHRDAILRGERVPRAVHPDGCACPAPYCEAHRPFHLPKAA